MSFPVMKPIDRDFLKEAKLLYRELWGGQRVSHRHMHQIEKIQRYLQEAHFIGRHDGIAE